MLSLWATGFMNAPRVNQYRELDYSCLITYGWEDQKRTAQQDKKRHFNDLLENVKYQPAMSNDEIPNISCLMSTGNLGQCPDLQQAVCDMYPDQKKGWIEEEANQLDFVAQLDSTIGATTRFQTSHQQLKGVDGKAACRYEIKIQAVALKYCNNKLDISLGSL